MKHLKRVTQSVLRSRKLQIVAFVVGFGLIGIIILVITRAATPTASIEVAKGTLSGPATLVDDATASGGKAIQFNSAGSTTCTGVAMTQGQADINNNPTGTTFCLSGTKSNWSLTPKSGNVFIGDGTAVLEGNNSTSYAVVGGSGVTNVILRNIEIRNYTSQSQVGVVNLKNAGTGWVLDNLRVHDTPWFAVTLGNGTQVLGGRYYNNRQGGITGTGSDNWVVDGAEIDHNHFTDNTYTASNEISGAQCGFEGGGMKWVGDNVTVKNSKVHDNACIGLWADIGPVNNTIINNEVYNNWWDGIFFEISTSATISGNTTYGNGFKRGSNVCNWGWGGGITVSSSGLTNNGTGSVNITGNTVYDNCNGITVVQQNRQESVCTNVGFCKSWNVTVSGNSITGSTRAGARNLTGAWTDVSGDNIANHNIIFGTNTIGPNMNYCKFSCP